ncbi:MAG: hypothetical protein EOP53_24280 [Sphingobacteriales bacterium]|nr:MAG: hypothetical protein EOP53_24280 [Sphingobacteriales bacterium]
MKQNLRPLPYTEFSMPEITAVAYETARECDENSVTDLTHDFNIALYKAEKLLNWVQLCACEESNRIEFRNRFIHSDEECGEISEKVLHYAEKWAAEKGYSEILIRACEVSLPYYLRNEYKQHGEPVCEAGNLLYTVIKQL